MKTVLLAFAVASVFAACDRNPKTSLEPQKDVVGNDTSIIYKNSVLTDVPRTVGSDAKYNSSTNRNGVISNNRTNNTHSTPKPNSKTYSSNTTNSSTQTTARKTQRRGWSHAAKGAAIGGVAGAITGAVISKNKGTGAVIGGVVGAGAGYIIGRSKDKKEGR